MIKHIYISIFCLFISKANAQSKTYNYTDLGVLFSQDDNIGSARFTGLNGAMGAVGGDLSSININPAGIAVYNNGEINLTVGSYNYNNTTSYYNSENSNKSTSFNIDQFGALFSLKDEKSDYGWSKVNLALNYQKTKKFDTRDFFSGNSNTSNPSFYLHPNDEDGDEYNNAISQKFYNGIEGYSSKFNLGLAGEYGDGFYAGASVNFHHIEFSQTTEVSEENEDDNGYVLNGLAEETLIENADGVSVNFGFIYKPIKSLRIGLAYQSPTWYNNTEDYTNNDFVEAVPEKNIPAYKSSTASYFSEYDFQTISSLTVSGALVIGRRGFLNVDYTYKGYNSLSLTFIDNFELERDNNQYFANVLKNTHNVNVGGEYRFKNISIRGGVGYEQSPFQSDIDPREIDVLKLGDKFSGSLGAGMRFGHSKIDIAYRKTVQNNEYDFNDSLQQYEYIQSGIIENNNSRIVATYNYSF